MQCQHLEEKGGGSKRAGVPTEESPGVVLWSEYQQIGEGGVQSSVYHTESTGKMVTPPHPIPTPSIPSSIKRTNNKSAEECKHLTFLT